MTANLFIYKSFENAENEWHYSVMSSFKMLSWVNMCHAQGLILHPPQNTTVYRTNTPPTGLILDMHRHTSDIHGHFLLNTYLMSS